MGKREFLRHALSVAGITGRPRTTGTACSLNSAHVAPMVAGGMDIGAHTHTHPVLAELDGPRQREERARPKEELEAAPDEPVTARANRVGSATAHALETCTNAKSVDDRFGFNFRRWT